MIKTKYWLSVLAISVVLIAGSLAVSPIAIADDDDDNDLSSLLCPEGEAITGILFEDDDEILDVICGTAAPITSVRTISSNTVVSSTDDTVVCANAPQFTQILVNIPTGLPIGKIYAFHNNGCVTFPVLAPAGEPFTTGTFQLLGNTDAMIVQKIASDKWAILGNFGF